MKELTSFYKREGENDTSNALEDELKILNEKLMRMYDVVKNDPKYMQRNYKATPNNIQNIMSTNNQGSNEYVPFNKTEEDDDSDQDF